MIYRSLPARPLSKKFTYATHISWYFATFIHIFHKSQTLYINRAQHTKFLTYSCLSSSAKMANSTETALEGLPRLPIISQASKAETSRLTPLSAVAPSHFLPLLKHSRVQVHMPLDTIHEEEPADDINIIVENNPEINYSLPQASSPASSLLSSPSTCFLQVMNKPLSSYNHTSSIACHGQYCA